MIRSIKDAANPFIRILWNATSDDGQQGIPYFQLEEIKEAAFQSDYACESILRGIGQRLDSKPSAIIVLKALSATRMLMLEGPAGFNSKIGLSAGKFLAIASSTAEFRKNTLEEKNRDLAQAIHKAIGGDSKALQFFSTGDSNSVPASTNNNNANNSKQGGSNNVQQSYKSEYAQQAEKEQKKYQKRKEEERRGGAVVIQEKLFDTYDSSLPPGKLVDSAVMSIKKKIAKEELDSFVAAAVDTERVTEICQYLDSILKDGKHSLQIRYKALMVVEAQLLVPLQEALAYFKAHGLGVARHMSLERSDNPTKSALTQQLASSITTMLQNHPMQQQRNIANNIRNSNNVNVSTLRQDVSSGFPLPVPSQQRSDALDGMFSNMAVKPAGSNQQQQTNPRNVIHSVNAPSNWAIPTQPLHHEFASNTSNWMSTGNEWTTQPTGTMPNPPTSQTTPAPFFSPSVAVVSNTTNSSSTGQYIHPSMQPSINPLPAAVAQTDVARQMEEMQQNMQRMMEMMRTQQPSTPQDMSRDNRLVFSGPSGSPPEQKSNVPDNNSNHSGSFHAPQPVPLIVENLMTIVPSMSLRNASEVHHASSNPITPKRQEKVSPEGKWGSSNPATLPVSTPPPVDTNALLLQLQQQMAASQQLLAQQQQQFLMLQQHIQRQQH